MSQRPNLLLAFIVFLVALPYAYTQSKPNILIILADDLGYRDLGCYGCADIKTPHIDSLAKEGAKFSSAYVTGNMCGPSRAGFITGKFQSSFGYYSNVQQPLDPAQGFAKGTQTIAKLIQDKGYVTGGVGKWHMGTADHQHPNNLGYTEWFGFLGGGLTYYPLNHVSYKGRYERLKRPWGIRDLQHTLPVLKNKTPVVWENYITHELTNAGVNFIEENHEEPFFLFMSYNAPHLELEAPVETISKYPEESMTKVPGVSAKSRSIYAAMVDEMDQGVGELLKALDKNNLTDNTIIWFLSDHGGMKRTSDNRPLRGGKGSNYEGGLRVPLIVKWPGHIKAGIELDEMVSSLDIGATSVALAGGDIKGADLHGVDLTSYMKNEKKDSLHKALFWRMAWGGVNAVMREGSYKLLNRNDKNVELYDIKNDIAEENNLAKKMPEKVNDMMKKWHEWDKVSQPPLWQFPKDKNAFQYANYEWLKGNVNYKNE